MNIVKRIEIPDPNWRDELDHISNFVNEILSRSGSRGVVIGLSGGVDSSVVATLLAHSIEPSKILGVIMPTSFTPREDIEDALWLADHLGIDRALIPIDDITDLVTNKVLATERYLDKMSIANLRARIRASILYLYANARRYLVAGTSDKSEYILGYFTKYGDGAADFLLITHLYKTQVRRLGRWLGLPERIYAKQASPQLYPGHKATDELPADYEILDQIMYALFDLGMKREEVIERLGFSREIVDEIIKRYKNSYHKRSLPPMPRPLILREPVEE
ncbi:MAG: NAD+ synthase [Sulfolobales archaeon]